MLVDTHCHIHESSYPLDQAEVLQRAVAAGIDKMIVVGTDQQSSRQAVSFAAGRDNVFAAIGVHPHEATTMADGRWRSEFNQLLTNDRAAAEATIVAIGEIGLDYFYTHSPRQVQIDMLEAQLQLAVDNHLPVIFHARDAFADFWPVVDNFKGLRGVLHSFTDTQANLDQALTRGFYIGVNGISTFTKDPAQKVLFSGIPLDRLLLETDAPFLTPAPLRGKVNEPAFVKQVAEHHATIRGLPLDVIGSATTANAHALFAI